MKKFLSILVLAGFIVSCEDRLEEFQPQDNVSDFVAFSNGTTTLGTLMGVYSTAQDGDVLGGTAQMVQDFMSDNVDFVGSFPTFQDVKQYSVTTDNGSLGAIYRDNFRLILAANNVIVNVPLVEDIQFSTTLRSQYIAEAKFLRAMSYMNLVNFFADAPYTADNGASLGVPIITEPFTGEVLLPARATVAEVHQQIITDLTEALADLPDSYSDADGGRGRATTGAVRAAFSRLHLYRGEFQQSADFAAQVINAAEYALAPDYSFWPGDASESEYVWAIANSAIDAGSYQTWYNGSVVGGRGDAPFSADLQAAHEAGDLRLALSRTGVDAEPKDNLFTTKFPDAVNNSDDAPVFRVTEMYLNRAEGLAEVNGVNQESIDLINELRTRAGLSTFTMADFATAADLIDTIFDERRKELAFEGHRRNDLLRRGLNLRPAGDAFFTEAQFGGDLTTFPIPQRELDLNSNLIQNSGY